MAQYISKDALVAEIERLVSNGKLKCQQAQENNDQVSYIAWSEHIATLGKIISLLGTLEVKKVGLDYIKKELDEVVRVNRPNGYGWGTLYDVATHFFELGLKAQKWE